MISPRQSDRGDLAGSIYFTAPLVFAFSAYFLQWLGIDRLYLFSEFGVYELLTFVFLFFAIMVYISLLSYPACQGWFKPWISLLLAGTIYFAGEEISWGQHFFSWTTPDVWQAINDQAETNLHNTHALLDQLPRNALSLAAGFGGIVVPLWRAVKNHHPSALSPAGWLWPTRACAPVCALALTLSPFDDWVESHPDLPVWLNTSGGELKEGLLALFILFYAVSLKRRLSAARD